MASTFESKKNAVLDISRKLAFKCIDGKASTAPEIRDERKKFVRSVEDRRDAPTLINQGGSSLCGPAAFMYCIAREKPDDFAAYVLDLALTGEGRLGNLKVMPGQIRLCRCHGK
ncbi:MAG: hypothetical protein LBP58_09675 [Azoarcus sp.]|nr:hypothetical protein [Azoarcus sp.]